MEELKEIAVEVQYEIDMMRHAARLFNRQPNRLGLHRTFYLEIFLLHLRNIRDFLYFEKDNPDDVAADDFIPSWSSNRPPLGLTIKKEGKGEGNRNRFNRALAHVSYSRLEYNKRGKWWNVPKLHKEIEGSWAAFFNAVAPERRGWFKSNYGPTHPP